MPMYVYQGFSFEGKKVKGMLLADHLEAAKTLLEQDQFVLTKLHVANSGLRLQTIAKRDLLYFTQDLKKLLKAGLALYEALLSLEEKYHKHKLQPILIDLCDKVKKGQSFSSALFSHPQVFDFLYCSMIKNAENSGSLEEVLEEISQMLLRQLTLKKQLFSALLYPGILFGFCLLVIIALLFFVVPSLFDLFEGKQNLHPLTKVVLGVSQFANQNIKILIFAFFLLGGSAFLMLFFERGKKLIYSFFLKAPFFNKMFVKVALVRFCRSFSTLLKGGVSYIQALKLAKDVMNHPPMQKEIAVFEDKVLEGKKLSEELKNSSYFPPLVSRMLSLAEQSATSSSMLQNIAEIYEEELEKSLANFSVIIQPIVLLILGLVVGFIVLAVLLPLTDVSSFISG